MRPADDRLLAALLLAAVALACGCEVGPNYRRPATPQEAAFKSAPPTSQPVRPLAERWWRMYEDPQLDTLVEESLSANQDIRRAVGRVEEARANARIAASYLLPTVNLEPGFTRTRTSGTRINPASGLPTHSFVFNDWLAPLDLTYEIDVWGRIRRSLESAQAQARASADDEAFVRLTVTTDVATYYFALRSLDEQDRILQETAKQFAEQVRVVSVQLKNGLVSPVDLYQAQTLLASAEAQQRDVERARANEEHALATLCGQPAAKFALAPKPLEDSNAPTLPPGLPGDLLRRRPDVAEAEQNLVSANAQVGVAVASFYPTFTLTGTAGFESASFSHLFAWQSHVASIGPGFTFPVFEAGRLQNNLAVYQARYRQASAAYIGQVLAAYADVEDALTDLHALSDEVGFLRTASNASRGYLRIGQVQYRRGLVNYLTVVDAERTFLSNQLSLAQAINQQHAASVHLVKALGGGWDAQGQSAQRQNRVASR